MASRGASPPFRARFSSRALSFFNFSFRRFFFLRSSSDEEEDDEEDDDEEDEEDEVDGDRLRRPIFGMRSDTVQTLQYRDDGEYYIRAILSFIFCIFVVAVATCQ